MSKLSPAGRLQDGGCDDWETPPELFDALNEEFGLTLDVCATHNNTKCDDYYTKHQDGLKQSWTTTPGAVWCNPPYNDTARWVRKGLLECGRGATVIMLINSCTGTNYWHDLIFPYAEVRFLRGRVKFIPPEGRKASSPTRDSAIVIFRPKANIFPAK